MVSPDSSGPGYIAEHETGLVTPVRGGVVIGEDDRDPVVVVCAANAAYALPLAVMLRSAASHLAPGRRLSVRAVDDGLDDAEKQRVARSVPERLTLEWVAPDRTGFAGLPLWGRMPLTTYDKLMVARLLPGVRKALWLDCDLLVLADLARLFDRDLGGHHALAVKDPFVPSIASRFGVTGHRDLGLDAGAPYFNAGVMLIDAERWRADDIAGRSLAYLRRYRDRVVFWDQEALNAVLAGRWGEIEETWNRAVSVDRLAPRADGGDGGTEAGILHFSGTFKPWAYWSSSAAHALYYRYLDLTAWSGWRPPRSWRGAALGRYEASRLRRTLYPVERRLLLASGRLTRRYAPPIVGSEAPAARRSRPATDRGAAPWMSVVLATDTFETAREVVERFRAQTIHDRLELVLVMPVSAAATAEARLGEGFGWTRIVAVDSIVPLAAARTAGVRTASAPLVFIGETHAFPHPGLAETLVRALDQPGAIVVPAFRNANPESALSWAAFLSDYGAWAEGLPPGELDLVPTYNAAYRRSFLIDLGDRLPLALAQGEEMAGGLRRTRASARFEPAARIEHANIARLGPWLHQRYVVGRVIAANRSGRWSCVRRLGYVCGSPLLPAVLVTRALAGFRESRRRGRVPGGTLPALVLGQLVRTVGETVGYARGAAPSVHRRLDEYELHKLDYARWTKTPSAGS